MTNNRSKKEARERQNDGMIANVSTLGFWHLSVSAPDKKMTFSRFATILIRSLLASSLLLPFGLLSTNAEAKDVSEPGFSYNVNLDLSYIDLLRRPDTSGVSLPGAIVSDRKTLPLADTSSSPQRSLGLKQMRIDLAWEEPEKTILELTLRPDAELRRYQDLGEEAKEYDSRAGQVYRSAPAIHLLDAYRLNILQGKNLSFIFGVLDEITPYYTSYPTPLTFGLLTMLPQKCSAIKILLKKREGLAPTIEPATASTLIGTITVFEGDRDRSELIAPQEKTYDRATSSLDPYRGIAISIANIPDASSEYGVLAGYVDSLAPDGKESENFFQMFASTIIRAQNKPLKISLDARYNRSSWDKTARNIKTLEQVSSSLTFSYKLLSDQWIALGGHVGKSDQHLPTDLTKAEHFQGWQIDLGVIKAISPTTNILFFVNQEDRKDFDGATTTGGFKNDSGNQSSLRRFALEFAYTI